MVLWTFIFFSSLALRGHAIDDPSVRIFDLDSFPDFEYSDIIEFYYLEASFPFTTPQNILEESGDNPSSPQLIAVFFLTSISSVLRRSVDTIFLVSLWSWDLE
jgi:hypothetical protein